MKKASGAKHFASIMGKSSFPSDSAEYKMVYDAVEILLNNGFGIIHGGYAGGAMSATSEAASKYISENGLPLERNIGVPQKQHETLWERVEGAVFTDVAENIFARLNAVTSGDVAIFAPLGGDGTEAEEAIIFHENVTRVALGEQPVAMIFLQTSAGVQWKKLIETKIELLTTSIGGVDEIEWLHFVDSIEELGDLVKEMVSENSL
ncbi:MAG TPA: hypothetical protein QF873_01915 [Patescibacteria group bacterium]|nr:hypothetical protein [Patescibacteria group bacterium]